MKRYRVVAVTFKEACAFVAAWHRHHRPPRGHKFSLGAAAGERLVGVAIVGRPVARRLQDGATLEVTRCCVLEGEPGACGFLYAAARRATFALGFDRVITYNQQGETGASLRAAGYRVIASRPAKPGWNRPSRPRDELGTEHVQRALGGRGMTPADYLTWALVAMFAVILVACVVVGAVRFALDRFRAHDDDRPADVPPEVLGWPTDIDMHDQPATLAPIGPDETRWRTEAEWAALEDLFADEYRVWAQRREPGRRD